MAINNIEMRRTLFNECVNYVEKKGSVAKEELENHLTILSGWSMKKSKEIIKEVVRLQYIKEEAGILMRV